MELDCYLDSIGLYRMNMALDGSCLFRAVADVFLPCNPVGGHLIVRRRVCKYLREHREEYEERTVVDFDEYLEALSMSKGYASPLELDVISKLYKCEFVLFHGPERPMKVTENGNSREVLLSVANHSYYETIYPKSYIDHLGFCQSIVYKVLYEDVFKLTDIDYAVQKMLHDRAAKALRERYLLEKGIKDDLVYIEEPGDVVNVKEVMDSGAILFPYKVAKALDPDMYRNINFDVWTDLARVGRRSTFWFGRGGPIRVGNRCHVLYDGHELTAHIQELSPENGPAVVYIEELALKRTVAYEDLIPISRSALRPDVTLKHYNAVKQNKSDQTRRRDIRESKHQAFDHGNDAKIDSRTHTGHHTLICLPPDSNWVLVDKYARISSEPDFSDLPLHDMPTLQFYYNLGIRYFEKGTFVQANDHCADASIGYNEERLNCEAYQGSSYILSSPEYGPPCCMWSPELAPPPIFPPTPMCSPEFCPPAIFPTYTDMAYPPPLVHPEHYPPGEGPPRMMVIDSPPVIVEPPPYAVEPVIHTPVMMEPAPVIMPSPGTVMMTPPSDAEFSPPLNENVPLPPLTVPPPSYPPTNLQDTPQPPRRGRSGTRYVMPPRFQRLQGIKPTAARESKSAPVQVPEVTSTVSPEVLPPTPVMRSSEGSEECSPMSYSLVPIEYTHAAIDAPQFIEDQYSPVRYYTHPPIYYHGN